jgi:hypothetical protein
MNKVIIAALLGLGFSISALAQLTPTEPTFLIAQAGQADKDLRNKGRLNGATPIDKRDDKSTKESNPAATRIIDKTGTKMCPGEFALCGASTCKPTGRKIEVKQDGGSKPSKKYDEAVCTCPIITQAIATTNQTELLGIAAVNEGNMNGSCTPPPDHIWSYFSESIQYYPQESTSPPFNPNYTQTQAKSQKCSSSGTVVNCWNFLCTIDKKLTNGVKTASCFCPIGSGVFGHPASPSADVVTDAGGYFKDPAAACRMLPVGGPVPS